MEKYCKQCGRVFDDLNFNICPFCGSELAIRYGRQPIPRKLRHEVFKRDGYRCRECGASKDETSLEIDHILPIAKGGTNDIDNLQTLCRECNRMKHTDEWVGGETDIETVQNELNSLEKQLNFAKKGLEQSIDEEIILDFKFKIKKLEIEEIPRVKDKLIKLMDKEESLNTKIKSLNEEKLMFDRIIKEIYLELDQTILLRLHNRIQSFLSIETQSIEQSLLYLLKKHSNLFNNDEYIESDLNNPFFMLEPIKRDHKYYKDYIYSFIYEIQFEKLNTTTNSIFDLGDLEVLIILEDGSNLTDWDDVKNKEDIIYVSEDLSNICNLSRKYEGLTNVQMIELVNIPNDVKSMSFMFSGCNSLKGISSLVNLDVSNVENMMGMFQNCESLFDLSGLKYWDISNVSNMSYMFENCKSLENLANLKNWNIFNVKDMRYIFADCLSLSALSDLNDWFAKESDIFRFSFSKIDLTGMFYNCSSLKNLKGIENWNVSQVGYMAEMFKKCTYLTNISALKNWDVSNVKTMREMFASCSGITFDGLSNIDALSDWDVSNVKNMAAMFHDCYSLEDISALRNWNVFNVKKINSMFEGCWHLKDVSPLEGWKISNDTYMDKMFDEWSVDILPKWYK